MEGTRGLVVGEGLWKSRWQGRWPRFWTEKQDTWSHLWLWRRQEDRRFQGRGVIEVWCELSSLSGFLSQLFSSCPTLGTSCSSLACGLSHLLLFLPTTLLVFLLPFSGKLAWLLAFSLPRTPRTHFFSSKCSSRKASLSSPSILGQEILQSHFPRVSAPNANKQT